MATENKATEKKADKKKIILGVAALVVVVILLVVIYKTFAPTTVEGSKTITIEVISADSTSTVYEVTTDAEYLRQAMDEADGLTYDGTEYESTGMFVETVNGETADYSTDGAYWAFYVNGEYCNYGVDSQPVTDGDAFVIEYTIYE